MMNKLLLPTLLFVLTLGSCIPAKLIFLAAPDEKDIHRFPYHEVTASENCFEFYESKTLNQRVIKVNDWTTDLPVFSELDEVLGGHAVRSMLVIQNDSLIYQYYRGDMDESSLHSSYSVAKSFTSALLGIAIDEGKIVSEEDLVTNYIPELKQYPEAQTMTIKHLLNHCSGIQYSLALDGKIYYGKDILKALNSLKFETLPGKKQSYLNINVQLLGIILERSTGQTSASYLEEKIWKPIGMCTNAHWTVDAKNEMDKTYCCLSATSLDYAKFGRLFLNEGNWDGKQVISEEWIQKSLARDTTEGSSFNYNYCWHIGLEAYQDYMAIGLYKQHIYINPTKNLIIVVFNDEEKKLKAERINWWNLFRQIADEM